jgi:hypothetical protein
MRGCYVERTAKALYDRAIVKTGRDITPDDMKLTVEQFYEQAAQERQARIDIALDSHLGGVPDAGTGIGLQPRSSGGTPTSWWKICMLGVPRPSCAAWWIRSAAVRAHGLAEVGEETKYLVESPR